jgi:hypothetical protein
MVRKGLLSLNTLNPVEGRARNHRDPGDTTVYHCVQPLGRSWLPPEKLLLDSRPWLDNRSASISWGTQPGKQK